MSNPIVRAMRKYEGSDTSYNVLARGRPEQDGVEAAIRAVRRKAFGAKLRNLRERCDLTLSQVSDEIGVASSRKLAQYETTCYPPGDIVCQLAPLYGVTKRELCELLVSHSDPALFEGLTGRRGYHPTESQISEQILLNEQEALEKARKANARKARATGKKKDVNK